MFFRLSGSDGSSMFPGPFGSSGSFGSSASSGLMGPPGVLDPLHF